MDVAAMTAALIGLLITACTGSTPATKRSEDPPSVFVDPIETPNSVHLETARSAAMIVATLPAVDDPRTNQEIALHGALYRAAYLSNVGEFKHFLLEPLPADMTGESAVPTPVLAIDERDFALRVLAELADLDVPIAWARPGRFDGQAEWFPESRERATRLRIRIRSRNNDYATVLAEVGDWTADFGSSRQAVTAMWDGQAWSIQRDRARLVW